jgi:hypothetical protein
MSDTMPLWVFALVFLLMLVVGYIGLYAGTLFGHE